MHGNYRIKPLNIMLSKTKVFVKSYDRQTKWMYFLTDFHNKEMPKAGSKYTCLAVISVDSALEKDENYYPQAFLKERKCIDKEVIKHITEDKEIFSSDSDKE